MDILAAMVKQENDLKYVLLKDRFKYWHITAPTHQRCLDAAFADAWEACPSAFVYRFPPKNCKQRDGSSKRFFPCHFSHGLKFPVFRGLWSI